MDKGRNNVEPFTKNAFVKKFPDRNESRNDKVKVKRGRGEGAEMIQYKTLIPQRFNSNRVIIKIRNTYHEFDNFKNHLDRI